MDERRARVPQAETTSPGARRAVARSAAPGSARTPVDRATVARMQAAAGNRATVRVLAREEDEEVEKAKGAGSRLKRWWGDLHLFESDKDKAERLAKEAAGPEKASEVLDDSVKLAKYVHDALEAGEAACEWTADAARYGDGRKQLQEIAENFGKAAKTFKKGADAVEWIDEKIELLEDTKDVYDAVRALNRAKTSEDAAAAFDKLFSAAGKMGKRLPDGPWTFYFEFLGEFSGQGGFFSNMVRKFQPSNRVSGYDDETMKLFQTNTFYEEANK